MLNDLQLLWDMFMLEEAELDSIVSPSHICYRYFIYEIFDTFIVFLVVIKQYVSGVNIIKYDKMPHKKLLKFCL